MSREQELLIEMVMRQTSLGFAEAKERLEINNNNYMIVIKEALGIKQKADTELKTLNQQIYTEIRGLMDNASDTYRKKKEMEEAIHKLDKSLLTAEQTKGYDEIEEDLKEHAEHIGKNGDHIGHQREHFSMMSEDVYDLVKAFGGGRELYHDHCPMYNENKGAMWLSEMKKVKNPYYGAKMLSCGTVEEVIR